MKLPCSLCALNSKALLTNWHNRKDILYSVECVARVSFMNTRAVYIYFMGRYIFCTSMANRINALQKYNMIMLHNGQFSTMLIVFNISSGLCYLHLSSWIISVSTYLDQIINLHWFVFIFMCFGNNHFWFRFKFSHLFWHWLIRWFCCWVSLQVKQTQAITRFCVGWSGLRKVI